MGTDPTSWGQAVGVTLDAEAIGPPHQHDRAPRLRSIELFTGAGGLALGTHAAGFRHEFLIEWEQNACETLRANTRAGAMPGIEDWADRLHSGDVRDVDFTRFADLDLVAGGAPCQPFSIGGRHRGMEDPRDMLPQFVRAVREVRPRAFLLENVRGLLRSAFLPYFEYVLMQLRYPSVTRIEGERWDTHMRRLGLEFARAKPEFHVTYSLMNAADYGVPQVRWRVLVAGIRADQGDELAFPNRTHSHDALLADQWVSGDYWERHEISRPEQPTEVKRRVDRLSTYSGFLVGEHPWRTVRDAIAHLPEPTLEGHADWPDHRLQPGARSYHGHSGSDLDLPSKTLKSGVHGVPGGENMLRRGDGSVRYYTVRETALIQTFPERWTFRGPWGETMRQLGNAVPVQLAQVVAAEIARRLLEQSPAA
jgi:DNA (cytosine-5)-methyltransferase 1